MKFFKYIILFTFLSNFLLHSQTLKFVRTDVEKARENFVTATYIFALDVYADNISNCTGVTFELRHNLPEYLKLSDWSYGDFGEKGSAVVIHDIDTVKKQGRLYVGVLSGEPVGFTGLNNPKLIHLEFAVSQAAPHGTELIFDVINSKAVIYNDFKGKIIDIYVPSFKFKVHSFTDVWPGDADNNGVVDTRDIAAVGLYLGYGLSKENFRSFKRENPSTFWTKQRALCWDSLEVTYADCDGNGDVNITDMLIIPLNFGKTAENPNNQNKPLPQIDNSIENCNNNYKKIPIYSYVPEPIIAFATRIDWKNIKNHFVCIDDNQLFGFQQYSFIKEHSNLHLTDLSIGSVAKNSIKPGNLILGWINTDISVNGEDLYQIMQAEGITPDGRIIPLKLIASAEDNNLAAEIQKNYLVTDGILNINLKNYGQAESIEVYDFLGNRLIEKENRDYNGKTNIDVSILASGYYYAVVKFKNHQTQIKFIKI